MTLADLDELVVRKLKHYTEINEETGCWNWVGAKLKTGYGVLIVRILGKQVTQYAHRVSYMLANQITITRFRLVCHKCDNPSCINPEHLFVGDPYDNMDDKRKKGRSLSGVKNPKAKLTENEVREIRFRYSLGTYTYESLANVYKVGPMAVNRIVNRKQWQHVE